MEKKINPIQYLLICYAIGFTGLYFLYKLNAWNWLLWLFCIVYGIFCISFGLTQVEVKTKSLGGQEDG